MIQNRAGLNPGARPVVKLDRGGADLEYFDSITAAATATGADVSNIRKAILGTKVEYAGGYKWRFATDGETLADVESNAAARAEAAPKPFRRPVAALKDGAEHARYGSITEAADATGALVSNICTALRKGTTSGGFHWRYL